MDAAPADAAAEDQADAAADGAQADAAPSGDAPQQVLRNSLERTITYCNSSVIWCTHARDMYLQEKAADAPEPGKVDPLSQPPHGTEVMTFTTP